MHDHSFDVGLEIKAIGKLGMKGLAKVSGSHSWDATSKWATKTGLRESLDPELLKMRTGQVDTRSNKDHPFNLKPIMPGKTGTELQANA